MKARNNSKLNAIFGVPYTADMTLNSQWYDANIISIDLPYPMFLAWNVDTKVTHIRVHKLVAKKFQKALTSVANKARQLCKQKYPAPDGLTPGMLTVFYNEKVAEFLHEQHLDLFGGTFEFRVQRGSTVISLHSYGIAIDIDPGHNPMGKIATTIPTWYITCWTDVGFDWGGTFAGKRVDSMHFEIKKP